MSKKPSMTYSQREYDRDHQMVKGVFKNIETPGASLRFPFRKYVQDGIKWYKLYHDQETELPLMVADHINKGCAVVEATGDNMGQIGPNGQPISVPQTRKRHRFAFVPTSFRFMQEAELINNK